MRRIARLAATALACLAVLSPVAATAQAWPTKSVRIIAVFPPGGSVDQVSRIFAAQLTAQGMEIVGGGPEEFDRFLKGEIDRWAKVVTDNKIKAGD